MMYKLNKDYLLIMFCYSCQTMAIKWIRQSSKTKKKKKTEKEKKKNVANLLKCQKGQVNFVQIMLTSGFFSVLECPSFHINTYLINLAMNIFPFL